MKTKIKKLVSVNTAKFFKIKNDINGNPRYMCHYRELSENWCRAIALAKTIGGRPHRSKYYKEGIVFTTYNIQEISKSIQDLKEN